MLDFRAGQYNDWLVGDKFHGVKLHEIQTVYSFKILTEIHIGNLAYCPALNNGLLILLKRESSS